MKAKRILAGLVLSFCVVVLSAQQEKQTFDEYRKEMLNKYDTHRRNVLEGYSEYLKGIWKDYQSFMGEKADMIPKPEKQPVVNSAKGVVLSSPWLLDTVPVTDTISLNKTDIPLKALSDLPLNKKRVYTFYDLEIELPEIEKEKEPVSFSTLQNISAYWEMMQKKHIGFQWISGMKEIVSTYGFNDWLEVDLVRHCVNQSFTGGTSETRIVFTHFALVHLGYDVRLGITDTKQLVLLIPFRQMVYGRSFIKLDGKKYHIYYDELKGREEKTPVISTYEIPEVDKAGREVDLIFQHPVTLPVNEWRRFSLTDGQFAIKSEVSVTLMKMLSHYPQMPVSCYAVSILQPELRRIIVEQVKKQVSGLGELEAVNRILKFVQYAFPYATDSQQFGYEKPFFMEELLYYPQCDCEDRAVFYAYLLRYVLNLDCHLVKYPGHECVAVRLTCPIEGSGYIYKGAYYSISDPTYVGAMTGMCMPDYLHEKPVIECWLGNNP